MISNTDRETPMHTNGRTAGALRAGIWGAALTVAGILLSGPIGLWSLGWVLTTPGVISYVGWNILVLALSIFVILSLRQRQAASR